ncbi:HNH endonuclease [Microvirga mediterraneensis]|uniref:HNH endonuclease n=1 Tax=Microvirga mediterraneensis TaxID=2754695 RepID=A0A838BPS2_9HYPH|nr:HNH endonuclease [Microvirga mediterraneensis]MBA1156933.1 HNH endonuclease [Microvirga mediterraneensis]
MTSKQSRAPKPLPSVDALKRALEYFPDTGVIVWRRREDRGKDWNAHYAGKIAGCNSGNGYLQIRFEGKGYRYHRVAWALHHGEDPGDSLIDHADGNPLNNCISNLRLASRSDNQRNCKAQSAKWPKGVKFDHSRQKFKAHIRVNGRRFESRRYDTPEQAHEAYKAMALKYHGEFARFK